MDKPITDQFMEQIEKIKEEICDNYCRFPFEHDPTDDETLEDKYCRVCPLTRL